MLWVAYLTAIGYGIDEAVWINVDETPIPYHVGGRRGWKKQKPVQALREKMVERATLQLQRSHCTLVASIVSQEEVQKVLPQVLLPKMTGKNKSGRRQWDSTRYLQTSTSYPTRMGGWT